MSSHQNEFPIPVHRGYKKPVRPVITLYYHPSSDILISWLRRGPQCTKLQLEEAIERSRGRRLPNDLLPSLTPGDAVQLADGLFWITPKWTLQAVKREQLR